MRFPTHRALFPLGVLKPKGRLFCFAVDWMSGRGHGHWIATGTARGTVGCSSLGSLTGYLRGLFVVAKQHHERV